MMSYENVLKRIYSTARLCNSDKTTRFKRLERALNNLGNPHQFTKSIHIAGTNGKGSVTTKLANVLQCSGFRVGMFTSPHIVSFRERIRVNGDLISRDEVVRLYNEAFDAFMDPPLYFELVVAMAFLFFRAQEVNWMVIETGMGGRLDATNILKPEASVITSIGWDHVGILGNSLEEIAEEKAGIIKSGVPVIVGPQAVKFDVFEKTAKKLGATFFPVEAVEGRSFGEENDAIVRETLRHLGVSLSEDAVIRGVLSSPPLRLQEVPSQLLEHCASSAYKILGLKKEGDLKFIFFDVGHNVTAFERVAFELLKICQERKIKIRIAVGLTKERKAPILSPFVSILGDYLEEIFFITIAGAPGKSAPEFLSELAAVDSASIEAIKHKLHSSVSPFSLPASSHPSEVRQFSAKEICAQAVVDASKGGNGLVFCGSFYCMDDALAAVGLLPPWADSNPKESNLAMRTLPGLDKGSLFF